MILHKTVWTDGLMLNDFKLLVKENQEPLEKTAGLEDSQEKRVKENNWTRDNMKTRYVGKVAFEGIGQAGYRQKYCGRVGRDGVFWLFLLFLTPLIFPIQIASYSKL